MIAGILASAILFTHAPQMGAAQLTGEESGIQWMPIQDVSAVVEKNMKKKKSKDDKLIFIDFYTDWCGWCKKLDKDTYVNPEVIEIMDRYFYAVKFDAEQEEPVEFGGQTYAFKGKNGRGTNEFALNMATRPNGGIGYPTITILDAKGNKIAVEAGYKNPAQMVPMLLYYGEGHYKTKDYNTFLQEYNQKQPGD